MWMLVPVAFALKLLSIFLQPLGSVWSSLGPLFLQLRAASWLAGGERSRLLQSRREAGEPSRAEGEGGGDLPTTPTSVNYHFTRQCNYKCGFCFHTAKTSFVLPLEEAKRGLLMLKEAGESPDPGKPSGAQPLLEGQRGWGGGGGGRRPGQRGFPGTQSFPGHSWMHCGQRRWGRAVDGCQDLPNLQSGLAWGSKASPLLSEQRREGCRLGSCATL